MAGINTLEEIYNKKGETFVKKLFSLSLKVTEKINALKLSFEYKDNNFIFYKRDSNTPINKIDRIISNNYEKAITYIESLSQDIKSQIPSNYKFYFEYLPNNKPNYILYQNLPKNNLIITHILSKKKDEDLESEDTVISNKKELDNWANIFNISQPPIIFEGFLSDKQKDKLMEYLRMTKEDIIKIFKTTSFSKFLISILNPELKSTILSDNLDSEIEGIIFSFSDNNYKVLAKIIDPFFEEIIKTNKISEERNDFLPIIFSDIIEFFEQELLWKNMKLRKKDVDDRYIEIISRMFNVFIDNFGNKYKNINITIPRYLRRPEFELNSLFIENTKTLRLINSSNSYKELFKIFLTLFRKKKKNIQEFLSPHVIKYQNNIVDAIYKRLVDLDENNTFLFEENSEELIEETYENSQNYDIPDLPLNETVEKEETIELVENTLVNEGIVENINTMKIVSFWQRAFDTPKNESIKVGKPVNIVIGKFQPFNEGHLESCMEIYKETKKPIVLFQLHNEVKSNSRPFSKSLTEKLLTKVIEENGKMFDSFHIIKRPQLSTINECLGDKKYISKICSNENYLRHFRGMLNEEDSENPIEFLELKKYIVDGKNVFNSNIIEMIKNNDYISFKKHTPKCIHGQFENMRSELK